MANYFSYLPNVYVGQQEYDGQLGFTLSKNLFRRAYLAEEFEKYITSFETFYLSDDLRPDNIAYTVYGDPNLDWLILLTNNITDIYTQWPKSTSDLNQYILDTYSNPDAVHHWETNKIMLDDGVTEFVKEGIEVNEDFLVVMPDGDTLSKEASIYPVSNAEHETYLNEKKRLITILNPNMVDRFIDKFKDVVAYAPNPEIDLEGNKKSDNSSTSMFINTRSYRSSGAAPSALGTAITSFDFGPTAVNATASTTTTTATTTGTVTTTTAVSSTGGSGSSSSSSSGSSSSSSSGSSGSSGGGYGGY